MKSHVVPKSQCPFCGYQFDLSSGISTTRRPNTGDPTICIKCAEVLIFDEQLHPRKPTPAELLDLQTNPVWPEIARCVLAVKLMQGTMNQRKAQ